MAAPTVIDFGAPDSVRAVEELQRGKCRTLLLQFGMCCTGSEADAEDLLSDAMQSICDPEEGRPSGSNPWQLSDPCAYRDERSRETWATFRASAS